MIRTEQRTESLYFWYFENDTTWDELHLQLDELVRIARHAEQPIHIVAFAAQRVPRGNPLPHLKRLIVIVNKHDCIANFVIVNQYVNIVAQRLIRMAMQMFDSSHKLHLVQTEAAAFALLPDALDLEAQPQ